MNLEWVVGTKITVEARRINIKEDQLVVPWESWCVLTPGVGKSKWRTAVSHQTLKVTLQVRLVEISVGSWLVAEVVSFIFWNWEVCHQLFLASRHFWSSSLLQWPLSAATGILVLFLTWEVTIHGKYISQGYKLDSETETFKWFQGHNQYGCQTLPWESLEIGMNFYEIFFRGTTTSLVTDCNRLTLIQGYTSWIKYG